MSINLLLSKSFLTVNTTEVTIKRRGDINKVKYMEGDIEKAIMIIVREFIKENFLTVNVTIIGDSIHIDSNDAFINYTRNESDTGYIINTNCCDFGL